MEMNELFKITIPALEQWDEAREEFVNTPEKVLSLEHSLVSISKWEQKWCKPFFAKQDKTYEELIDYVKCMTITQNVEDEVYSHLTLSNVNDINTYINAPMTATWFSEEKIKNNSREQITSELIYYWMLTFNIPHEFQKWHINRLLTLIRVCEIKNQPPKSRSKKDIMRNNAALNSARRKRFNSRG